MDTVVKLKINIAQPSICTLFGELYEVTKFDYINGNGELCYDIELTKVIETDD